MRIDLFWNVSKVVSIVFCAWMALIPVAQAETSKVMGTLLERGTKTPLSGVNVFIVDAPKSPEVPASGTLRLKTTTDERGQFVFEAVPLNVSLQWVINFSGYERFELEDELDSTQIKDGAIEQTLYLEKKSYQVYETTIYSKQKKRDDTTRSLKAAQIATLPGVGNDPVKAVQTLPGVNRASSFSSVVVIQGSSPNDTVYTIDDHAVPLIFHFGGLSSVVQGEAIDRVDLNSAGYGPELGRALGGLVSVYTRPPKRNRLSGFVYADFINAGGMIEAPLGKKSSFFVGARQSYIGAIAKAALKNNEDFNLTVIPRFGDVQGAFETEVTDRDFFKLYAIGSQDNFEFLLAEPLDSDPAIRGAFSSTTTFYRLIPQWTHVHSPRTTSRFSFGLGRDFIKFTIGEDYFDLSTWTMTARGEVERQFSDRFKSYLGYDNRYVKAKLALRVPSFSGEGGVFNPLSAGTTRQANVESTSTDIGIYSRNEWGDPDSGFLFKPHLRLDRFKRTQEWLISPRAALKYSFTPYSFLRTAGGLYYQPPQEQQSDSTFGNPEIKAPRSWHYTVGVDHDFREGRTDGFHTIFGLFYRYFDRLVIPSSALVLRNGVYTPQNFSNLGKGKSFGAETRAEWVNGIFKTTLSYTLSKSTRSNPSRSDYPHQYDQTHIVDFIPSIDQNNNWKISGRLRYVTGSPNTPITSGVFDSDNDVYLPVRGAFYSQRVSPFMQVDFRLDKKWIYDKWILTAYLDIQNILNRKNAEQIQYSYDYSKTAVVSGLPFFPSIGLKGEF